MEKRTFYLGMVLIAALSCFMGWLLYNGMVTEHVPFRDPDNEHEWIFLTKLQVAFMTLAIFGWLGWFFVTIVSSKKKTK